MSIKKLELPLSDSDISELKIGEMVFLSGKVYTARDNTHMRLIEMLAKGQPLPFELNGLAIYYMGPTPAKKGFACGSAGPTTSSRMDKYTPCLLAHGLKVMIGKGNRSEEVKVDISDNKAVYFATVGGAGAYLASKIKKMQCIAFPEFGPEAVYELEVEDFPVVVSWK